MGAITMEHARNQICVTVLLGGLAIRQAAILVWDYFCLCPSSTHQFDSYVPKWMQRRNL
jgi:hypothetical protein